MKLLETEAVILKRPRPKAAAKGLGRAAMAAAFTGRTNGGITNERTCYSWGFTVLCFIIINFIYL